MNTWLAGLISIAVLESPLGGQWVAPRATAVFPNGTTVRLEIAETPATRQRGLMFRQALGSNEGMVFLFERPGSYPFGMQNCQCRRTAIAEQSAEHSSGDDARGGAAGHQRFIPRTALVQHGSKILKYDVISRIIIKYEDNCQYLRLNVNENWYRLEQSNLFA